MNSAVRWTIKVSKETDTSLRTFLAMRGMKKGDLSKFIEDAVRWRVFDQTVRKVRARNKGVSDHEIKGAVEDAVEAVRGRRKSKK